MKRTLDYIYKQRVAVVVMLFVLVLVSCEKEVKINLANGDSRIVVEGAIETNVPPYVFLTKSIGYFAKIDLNTLQNSFVHNAVVTVSNGSKTVTLKEYSLDTGGTGAKLYFYSVDTSLPPSEWMIGEVDRSYTLTIESEGKTYQAITKIPNPTQLDSVNTAIPSIIPDNNPDVREIKVFFKDPDTLGNYMRYFTKRNSEGYFPGLNSVYPDELINGTLFQTTLAAGENRNTIGDTGFDSLGFFHPGDTVTLKWCAIDKGVYDFYSTFEFAIGTIGSPFASPISVKTNVNNNALGIWAGYGTIYKTLIIE
ncbi:MAG: DUF4249 family protein [Sphingobacteriales bacterium]|nr:MAG: DUF4249 family protein [Sphingobacteriales bacterium]